MFNFSKVNQHTLKPIFKLLLSSHFKANNVKSLPKDHGLLENRLLSTSIANVNVKVSTQHKRAPKSGIV